MKNFLVAYMAIILGVCSAKGQDAKLSGTVIGTEKSVDYGTDSESTTVNTRECAFDGNLNTYFAAYDRSYAWVGLDLGEPHIITRIGWAPAKRSRGDERILLGVFEGANTPDFMDAISAMCAMWDRPTNGATSVNWSSTAMQEKATSRIWQG